MPATVDHVGGRRSLTSALAVSLALVVLLAAPLPAAATSGAPVISGASPFPMNVTIGGSLTLFGSNLGGPSSPGNGSGQVLVNGVLWPVQFGDDTSIQVLVPSNATSGILFISTSFGSFQESNLVTVSGGAPNPLPVLSSLIPSTITATAAPVVIQASGTGFVSASQIRLNGSPITTTFNGSSLLTGTVPATFTQFGVTVSATVFSPTPGGGTSSSRTLTIANPIPAFTSFSPPTGVVGTAFMLTVNGSGFDGATTLDLGGTPVSTTFVSPSQLTALIPANFVPCGVSVTSTISNPTPGGGSTSGPFTFLNPQPQLFSLSPSFAVAGGPTFTLSINGSGFTSNAQVRIDGSPTSDQFVNPNLLTVTVPSTAIMVTGTAHTFTVVEPQPGGGTSNVLTLPVLAIAPVVESLLPPVTILPPLLDPILILHVSGPIDLPVGGTVTATVIQDGGGGSTVLFTGGTTVFGSGGFRYDGLLRPPQFLGRLLAGIENAIQFDEPGGPLTFDRPVRITIPAPSGSDPFDFQPVFVGADNSLTFLPGTVSGTAIAFDTLHFSTFGLARVATVPVKMVAPAYTLAAGFHARWAGQSEYTTLRPGQEADFVVRYLNTGTEMWILGLLGYAQANLGSNAPRDNTRDYERGIHVNPYRNTNRFATMDQGRVAPGEAGTFTMRVRAPATAGTYRIDVGLVIDGVTWLEDEGVYLQFTVVP